MVITNVISALTAVTYILVYYLTARNYYPYVHTVNIRYLRAIIGITVLAIVRPM